MAGFREVLAHCDPGGGSAGLASPVTAWTATRAPATQSGAAASLGAPLGASGQDVGARSSTSSPSGTGQHTKVTTFTEAPPPAQDKAVAEGKKATGDADRVCLVDSVKCKVYVYFEGLLGAHLKQEVRDRIWKGEYVEIFSLLPLEKFNLDRVKPDESKKEEEERRRYRLIPRMFGHWLQVFNILASIIGASPTSSAQRFFAIWILLARSSGYMKVWPG